jgi:hypothetical protein
MKRAERPLYPLRRTKDEDVLPQTTHFPSLHGSNRFVPPKMPISITSSARASSDGDTSV